MNAGRPSAGTLYHIKCSVSAKYKAAIMDAYINYEEVLSDVLLDHYRNKRVPEFLKCWNARLGKNVGRQVGINGFSNDVANELADHLSSVFAPNEAENLKTRFSIYTVSGLMLHRNSITKYLNYYLLN